MEYVLSRTKIATPKLRRYFFTEPEDRRSSKRGYIVMDYVEGDVVEDVWANISHEKRTDIVVQVANIVSQLQAVQFAQPGPVGGGECRGLWFSHHGAGPFHSKDEFNAWFTRKLEDAKLLELAKEDLPSFDYSLFVLVHQDIHPGNLILDGNGKVWIIDWRYAGAYPAIFEAAAAHESSTLKDFSELLVPRIYNSPKEMSQLMSVPWAVMSAGYDEVPSLPLTW